MPNRPHDERNIRSLNKGKGSYTITIPVEYVKELKWKAHQKLKVELKGEQLIISDWKK